MGWYYTDGASKQDIISELITDGQLHQEKGFYRKCLEHSVRGNELYSVWTLCDRDNQEIDIDNRWIGVDILTADKDGWGYKPMDESVHPYYYRCPLKFLKMVTRVACQDWRDEVIKHHNLMKGFSDGDTLIFENAIPLTNGTAVQTVIVEDMKRRIYSDPSKGIRFRLSRRVFSNAYSVQKTVPV